MNAESYSAIANEVFAPLYPYYAEMIVNKTGICSGACLDVGCGCGHLGMALAEAGAFTVCSLDNSAEMTGRTAANAHARGLSERVQTLQADVGAMPLPTGSFDLVVSRGSMPFWKDLAAAFSEILRVLKPGGHAYVGGGLGPKHIREKIEGNMRKREPGSRWSEAERIPRRSVEEYECGLRLAGIADAIVDRGDEGTWVRFVKP
ncbi:MAG: class I SAM-dependent methyltransferase [Terracidiphilus sp.]|nr:class I SAM-dependent methyltransferase [Terracidiphilus sp.]